MREAALVQGATFSLREGANVYVVVERDSRHILVRCLRFNEREDLGDQIFCDRDGWTGWVALFHAWAYKEA